MNLIAAISGSALVNACIWIIIAGVIFGLLMWLLQYCAVPEPFNKIARVIIAIVAVVFLINALLSLVGKSFITL